MINLINDKQKLNRGIYPSYKYDADENQSYEEKEKNFRNGKIKEYFDAIDIRVDDKGNTTTQSVKVEINENCHSSLTFTSSLRKDFENKLCFIGFVADYENPNEYTYTAKIPTVLVEILPTEIKNKELLLKLIEKSEELLYEKKLLDIKYATRKADKELSEQTQKLKRGLVPQNTYNQELHIFDKNGNLYANLEINNEYKEDESCDNLRKEVISNLSKSFIKIPKEKANEVVYKKCRKCCAEVYSGKRTYPNYKTNSCLMFKEPLAIRDSTI